MTQSSESLPENWKHLSTKAKQLYLQRLRLRNERQRSGDGIPNIVYREPYEFYGANAEFRGCLDHTVVLSGPSETGKTLSVLTLLHEIAILNKNIRGAIVRKVRDTMYSTVLQTFQDKVLPNWDGRNWRVYYEGYEILITPFGGDKRPVWYQYSNGSRLYVAGIDKPGKVLSGELDIAYVNQAEEITQADIETLQTRTTGRAGNIKTRPPQLLMDCNPAGAKHPIKVKEAQGALTLFNSRHQDNPTLYDQISMELTEQGQRTIAVLKGLKGIRLERLYFGRWAGAEGLYFSHFDSSIHGLDDFELDEDWRVWASLDYGYNHWNIFYLHAEDNDGVVYTFEEIAHRHQRPNQIAPDFIKVLERYGLTLDDLDGIVAGGDVFARTGNSETTVSEKYEQYGIYLERGEVGPGSRVAKAHHLLDLLGDQTQGQQPRWYYVKDRCPMLATCLPALVPNPNNPEDVRKVNCNSEGDGGDDAYDSLMLGLMSADVIGGDIMH